MVEEQRLRTIRRSLFDQIEAVNSSKALFEVQLAIVQEIQSAEQALRYDKCSELKWHIKLLRYYGDTIAWSLLHPHTIRQLSSNPARPVSLLSQGYGLKTTLQVGREYAEDGMFVLIADITNCIRIGDIILCHNPELPTILECKTKIAPGQLTRGRARRQLMRIAKISKYLATGEEKLYGQALVNKTVTVTSKIEHNWDAVNQAVKDALRIGEGFAFPSSSDVLWAYAYNEESPSPNPPQQVNNAISEFGFLCVGCHGRPIEEGNCLIPPPLAWPIDNDCRFALMEEDVLLCHFVDIQYFKDVESRHGKIIETLHGKEFINGFIVEVNNQRLTLAPTFLDQIIYGFQTIDSTVRGMIEFALKVSEVQTSELVKPPANHERIILVSENELAVFSKELETKLSGEYLAIPADLVKQIRWARKHQAPSDETASEV